MSYDIRIGVKVEGLDVIAVIDEPDHNSPTYNIGDLVRKCTGWDFKQGEWYRVSDVVPMLMHGLEELTLHSAKYRALGEDYSQTGYVREVLQSILECIAQNTGDSYWTKWQQIPAEHLWIAW